MGTGAVERGEGLIEHRNDPRLLLQRDCGEWKAFDERKFYPLSRCPGASGYDGFGNALKPIEDKPSVNRIRLLREQCADILVDCRVLL